MLEKLYDMVLFDKDLPDREGHTYVIGMLSSREEVARQKWLQAGMDHYLVKPFRFREVEKMLFTFARRYREDRYNQYVA